MDLKIGADPELWIYDNKLGKIISAHGLFPGTKEEPYAVEHGAIQVDGMAAEYNINPAKSVDEFIFFNISVLRSLRDEIQRRNPELDFDFKFTPVADFGADYINQQPEIARILGCSPDFNAWDEGRANPTPDADLPFRTASGHIHLGWGSDYDTGDPEHIEACCMMAKALDIPISGRLLAAEGNEGQRRRQLYGKAGAFRPKSYGMEYRTPSNAWVGNTGLMRSVYNASKKAFDELVDGYSAAVHGPINYADKVINSHDRGAVGYYYNPFRRTRGGAVTVATLDKLYKKAKEDAFGREVLDPVWDVDFQPIQPGIRRGARVMNNPVVAPVAPPRPIMNDWQVEVMNAVEADEDNGAFNDAWDAA